jgi:hypothetical protein
MITKTRVLVLRCTPYGDHAVVARLFTRELGAYSYMLHGIRSKKSRITPAMLHPMALLDAEVFHKPDSDLQRVHEMHPMPIGKGGYGSSTQLLGAGLIAEVLSQAIHDHDPQTELFDWLVDRMEVLLGTENTAEHVFALLTDLSAWLGFSVDATTYRFGSRLSFSDGVFIVPEATPPDAKSSDHIWAKDPKDGAAKNVQNMSNQQAGTAWATGTTPHTHSSRHVERAGEDHKRDFADAQSSFEMAYYLSNSCWPDRYKCTEAYLQAVYGLYARHLPSFRIPRSHPMFCGLVLRN